MINRFRVWRDRTMVERTCMRLIVIYTIVLMIAVMAMICFSIGASITGVDVLFIITILVCAGLIIKTSYELADEVKYLREILRES